MNHKAFVTLTMVVGVMAIMLVVAGPAAADLPAFQGAYGFGAGASGGRGGDVYHVTSLSDSGAGSLRYGIETANNPRTIVFDTGGTIYLASGLDIDNPNLTIAGQTAPGGGITLANQPLRIRASDVIVRYLRTRLGDISGAVADSLTITSIPGSTATNIIVDHVSASWGVDENLSVVRGTTNVTVQNCIISEGLDATNSYGSLLHPNVDSYLSVHHNLFAHNQDRNPCAGNYGVDKVTHVDWRNNVIYNWGNTYAGYGTDYDHEYVDINMVGNYYIRGPNGSMSDYPFRAGSDRDRIWQAGNKLDMDRNGLFDGIDPGWGMVGGSPDYIQMPEEFDYAPVPTDTAADAVLKVLTTAGASLYRDTVDERVVQGVYSADGDMIIDSQTEVGGWPSLSSGTAPLDTDQDGMPDYWEDLYGLNKYLATDRNDVDLSGLGYTNLEVYLDNIVGVSVPEPHSLVLLVTALLGVLVYAWRKRI